MGMLAKLTGMNYPRINDEPATGIDSKVFASKFAGIVANAGQDVQDNIAESEQAASPKSRKKREQIRTEKMTIRFDPKIKAAAIALATSNDGKSTSDGIHLAFEMLAKAGLIPPLDEGQDDA